jgi:class 3 adenylate cyclase
MMPERVSRTFICSVLFLDIVDYSRKPVAEQIQLKDRFNTLISSAIQEIPTADRIVLDTGDGAAISFLGDPEDALFVAMSLRDTFAPEPNQPPEVPARIGINLGPVRMVKDPNGQPNIIGDGINVSQRVMGFAKTGQILVSRSYFEIVSHISENYNRLFSYEGSRTDKNVRDHEIYSVGDASADPALKPPSGGPRWTGDALRLQTAVATVATTVSATVTAAIERFVPRLGHWLNNRSLAYGTAVFSSGAFLLAVLTSVMGTPPEQYAHPPVKTTSKPSKKVAKKPGQKPPLEQIAKVATKEAAPRTGNETAPDKNVDAEPEDAAIAEPAPEPVKKRRFSFFSFRSAPETEVVDDDEDVSESVDGEAAIGEGGESATISDQIATVPPDAASPKAVSPDEASPESASSKPVYVDRATVVLAIAPWGEVYVDGDLVGVSPPLNKVELMPGLRTIEIRNGAFPGFSEKIELKAGQNIKIRHKFN